MSVQVISFNCILKNKVGSVISTTFNRDVINSIEGQQQSFLSGLVQGLQNLKKGEKRKIILSAEQAYGYYDPKKVALFPRKKVTKDKFLRLGETVSMASKNGQMLMYRVIEIYGDMVVLDGNHPLAGQDLIFEIEAVDARDATPEEIVESSNMISSQVLH
ncbi:MAG: FKBP-type peptidyl-prolyl cis-trans isomerase [Pseudobdellovibrionaceae bacterium]